MAAVKVEYVVDSHDVLARLDQLEYSLSGRSLMRFLEIDVEEILHTRVAKRFEEEGDDASGGWDPLAPRTIEIRDNALADGTSLHGGAHPINRRTDEMFNWITTAEAFAGEDGDGATLEWPGELPGDENLYEKFHLAQFGRNTGRDGAGSAPARPVVDIGPTDVLMIISALSFHLELGKGVLA